MLLPDKAELFIGAARDAQPAAGAAGGVGNDAVRLAAHAPVEAAAGAERAVLPRAGGEQLAHKRLLGNLLEGDEGAERGAPQTFDAPAVPVGPRREPLDDFGDAAVAVQHDRGGELDGVGTEHDEFQHVFKALDPADAADLAAGELGEGGGDRQRHGPDVGAGIAAVGGHDGLLAFNVDARQPLEAVDRADGGGARLLDRADKARVDARVVGELDHHRDLHRRHNRADKLADVFRMARKPLVFGADGGADAQLHRIGAHPLHLGGDVGGLRGGRPPDRTDQHTVPLVDPVHLLLPLLEVEGGIEHRVEKPPVVEVEPGPDDRARLQGDRFGDDRGGARVDRPLNGGRAARPGTGGHDDRVFQLPAQKRHC